MFPRSLLLTLFAVTISSGCGTKTPERCELPFEPGQCLAGIQVVTYVDGRCELADYGGCGGNENRFPTLDECLQTCEGRSARPDECPHPLLHRTVCTACGPAGGCAESQTGCFAPCGDSTCASGQACVDGVCQVTGCD